jgi:hypothetical protein
MAADANIDQLQELLLRLTHLADGTTNTGQGAAVALHCLLCSKGPHTYMVGVISAQSGTRKLLQCVCRSNSSVASTAAAGMLSRPVGELLLPAVQATPEQVGDLICEQRRCCCEAQISKQAQPTTKQQPVPHSMHTTIYVIRAALQMACVYQQQCCKPQ